MFWERNTKEQPSEDLVGFLWLKLQKEQFRSYRKWKQKNKKGYRQNSEGLKVISFFLNIKNLDKLHKYIESEVTCSNFVSNVTSLKWQIFFYSCQSN